MAKKADATLKKLKLKIRPSQLDGFENYPELPESIETFSPEEKSQSARKKKHTKAAKSCVTSIPVTEDIFVSFFKSTVILLNFFEIEIVT